jgi:N-acetylglucosaminyldiphosphoundecaprenol N-acetyl-beta-D-mannosaminyltransferase
MMRLHYKASMITPDGMPLVLLGKLLGKPIERTCGADLIESVCAQSAKHGLKHYLYGGVEGVAEELKKRFEKKYPGLEIVGVETPPFRALTKEEDDVSIKRIIDSGADVVWVGLSTPKQEWWMRAHVEKLPATLIGIGAAFDFHTGRVKRAPKWMQDYTLEWLHRLLSEPKRLWRRYLLTAPKFLTLVLRDILRGHYTAPKTRSD